MALLSGKRPIVGVTGPDKGGFIAWIFTWLAIWRAGGIARRIKPKMWRDIPDLHGLIISGGADVSPELYGAEELEKLRELSQKKDKRRWLRFLFFFISFGITLIRRLFSLGHTAGPDPQRDELEQRLLVYALEHKLPILGICRGMQFINVHMGGTLHQDISPFYNETPQADTIYPRKRILIEPESRLSQILGYTSTRVNSLHNQAVNLPGKDIRLVAREPNGVVQALELTTSDFVMGIQWHPEYLPQIETQQRLFRELVKLAAKCIKKTDQPSGMGIDDGSKITNKQ